MTALVLVFTWKIVQIVTTHSGKRTPLFHRVIRVSVDRGPPLGSSMREVQEFLLTECGRCDIPDTYWKCTDKFHITSEFAFDLETMTYHVVFFVYKL